MKFPLKSVAHFVKRQTFLALRTPQLLFCDPLSEAGRSRIKRVCAELGWGRQRPAAPVVELESLCDSQAAVRVGSIRFEFYNTSFFELFALCWLAASRRPKRLFEIGTFDGRSTLNLASNTDPDAVVHTIDLPPGEGTFGQRTEVGCRFRGSEIESKIVQHFGNTREFDFSPYEASMDFVFVDASHAYEDVVADTDVAMRLIRPTTGIVVWHDYATFEGVCRALDERSERDARFRRLRLIKDTTMAVLVIGSELADGGSAESV